MTTITKGRLTKAIKNEVINSVERELDKLSKPIAEREDALILDILKSRAGKYWDQLCELPADFIQKTRHMYISLTHDQREEIMKDSGIESLPYSHRIETSNYYPGSSHSAVDLSSLSADKKKEAVSIIVDRCNLNVQVYSCLRELKTVLNSVTNVKDLLEVWPEAEQHLPEAQAKPIKTLPAVQTTQLDSMLPVEEAA